MEKISSRVSETQFCPYKHFSTPLMEQEVVRDEGLFNFVGRDDVSIARFRFFWFLWTNSKMFCD